PKTNSVIIKLIPKKENELYANRHSFIFNQLFLSSTQGMLIKNCLRESFIRYSSEKITRNQARNMINEMKIGIDTLNKSFDQLNNNELRTLSRALR
ncbi:hypothetical protein KJ845_00860, partial [Patescibacteria group bacterium]|nr:hypothetical protein [Patescibacteria group bacterium]